MELALWGITVRAICRARHLHQRGDGTKSKTLFPGKLGKADISGYKCLAESFSLGYSLFPVNLLGILLFP